MAATVIKFLTDAEEALAEWNEAEKKILRSLARLTKTKYFNLSFNSG
jgi:hypothetical protein